MRPRPNIFGCVRCDFRACLIPTAADEKAAFAFLCFLGLAQSLWIGFLIWIFENANFSLYYGEVRRYGGGKMNNSNSADRIHGGHRARMRAKLISYGNEIFDTYELLEMLLYNVIPGMDMNPTAKRLLRKFGNINGVLSAEADEPALVEGVGAECAELIRAVGELGGLIGVELCEMNGKSFTRYTDAGEYFARYFGDGEDYRVAVAFLDNAMRILGVNTLFSGLDYGNGKVEIGKIVRRALDLKATSVITSHNHPFGPLFPTPEDRTTNTALTDALCSVGVLHLEHFIVCGNRYIGIMNHLKERFAASAEIYEFLSARDRAIADGLMDELAQEVEK